MSRERSEGVVLRPDLFARLEAAPRVTLVAAPAGSGKSYLLQSWSRANEHGPNTAWVTVDRFEPTAERFWAEVATSLGATKASAEAVGALALTPDLDGWGMVERLLEALANTEQSVWLVVDDLHALTSPEALSQLELFVMRAPESVRFVFATRREPSIGLHRLRVGRELAELRADDLRFSFADARALFDEAHVELSNEALTSLLARTEGWVAGLRLAALCLVGHPDPEAFVREFSGSERTVGEYLLAEVLDRQPQAVRRLLLRTSLFEKVTASLADHLTGTTGSDAILLELERANAFVAAVDAQRLVFRYHRLFAELLQSVLRREEPTEVDELYRRAAQWYAENGYVIDAARCAVAAQDWTLTKAVLLQNFLGGFSPDDQLGQLADILGAFPAAVAAQDAVVPSMMAVNHVVCGAIDAARRALQLAEATLDDVAAEDRTLVEALMTVARVTIARDGGDILEGFVEGRAMLAAAEGPEWDRLGLGDAARSLALTTLGVNELWAPEPDDAERHLDQALAAARRAGRPYLILTVMAHHAMSGMSHSPQLAEERAVAAIDFAETHGWADEPRLTMARLALASSLLWRGRLEDAEAQLNLVCPVIRPEARPLDALTHRYLIGTLAFARGSVDDARRSFEQARRMAGLIPMGHLVLVKSHALWLHCLLRQGEVARVGTELGKLNRSLRETAELRTLAGAAALARAEPEAALERLARVDDGTAPRMLPEGWMLQPLLFAARAYAALGDAERLAEALESALDLAEPRGEILPFLLHLDADLLTRHLRAGTSHAALIAQILDSVTGCSDNADGAAPFALRDPLTARETRVLRYLPTNLTTREIGEEMFVSVNTVKTHMRHLYKKLGVDRRGDAVARARTLGLLAPARHQ